MRGWYRPRRLPRRSEATPRRHWRCMPEEESVASDTRPDDSDRAARLGYASRVLAGVLRRQGTAKGAEENRRVIGRLGWPAAAVVGAVVLFFCGLHEARNLATQSDGASIALQA